MLKCIFHRSFTNEEIGWNSLERQWLRALLEKVPGNVDRIDNI